MRRRRVVVRVLIVAIFLTGWAVTRTDARRPSLELKLTEGQTASVSGMDLVIDVRKVRDLTSEGCVGGPVGCPDHASLEVSRGDKKREITLYVPKTESQRKQRVDQAEVLGFRIVLKALQRKQIVLEIEENPSRSLYLIHSADPAISLGH